MPEIVWDALDERWFERGVDHGVLYLPTAGVYSLGVPWNGLTTVTESPSGAESNKQYADNMVYVDLLSAEEFNATIEAFTTPVEFLGSDGTAKTTNGMQVTGQARKAFGFSWRTLKGNVVDEDAGFILHLAYGLKASPSEKANNTVNDTPELTPFSFSVSSTPVVITGMKPSAHIRIDSTDSDVDPAGLEALMDVLYGRGEAPADVPRLPLPDEVNTLLAGTP